MITEIWKEHPYLGIRVSNIGRVETRNLGKHFGCNMNNKPNTYKVVGWKGKMYLIHRLIYQTFIGEIPEGYEVNHIDENKTNNRIWNLNLMTRKENLNWGTHNERVAKTLSKPVNQYTKDGILVREWASTMDAERLGGFNQGHVSNCCLGKRKSHGGFIWKYKEIA